MAHVSDNQAHTLTTVSSSTFLLKSFTTQHMSSPVLSITQSLQSALTCTADLCFRRFAISLRSTVMFLLSLMMTFTSPTIALNPLCDTTTWNVRSGDWTFSDTDCTLQNNGASTDVIEFNLSNTISTSKDVGITFQIHSGSHFELIIPKLSESISNSAVFDGYAIRLHPELELAICGVADSTIRTVTENIQIDFNIIHTLTLRTNPEDDTLSIYLDDTVICTERPANGHSGFMTGDSLTIKSIETKVTLRSIVDDEISFDSAINARRLIRNPGIPTREPATSRTIFLGPQSVTFDEAEAYCASRGRHLTSIHSTAEQARAAVLCKSATHYFDQSFGCWIGMAYFFGQWMWNDNSDIDYGFNYSEPNTGVHPWADGQPNTTDRGREKFTHCVHLSREMGFLWDDINCIEHRNYPICSDDGTGEVLYNQIEPFQVEEDNLVTYIDIGDRMHFEWSINIISFPRQGWANIFSCGGSEDVKMPSIYIHPNSDDEGAAWEGFLIVWSTNLDWNNYISPGPYLMRNKTYDVVLDVTQKRLKLTIDGDVVYNQGKDSHENLLTVPCFASAPFEDSADVEISNILIAPDAYGISAVPGSSTQIPFLLMCHLAVVIVACL